MTFKAILSACLCALALGACTLDTKPGTGAGSLPAGACGGAGSACSGSGGAAAIGGAGMAGMAGTMSVVKRLDGEACTKDADCTSAHCTGNVCCASGDCCRTAIDCPSTMANGLQLACNDPATCQGSGGSVVCMASRCMVLDGVPNDSACTPQHRSKSCAPYKPVFCNGTQEQTAPVCATSCESDTDCADTAHCTAKRCVSDVPAGGVCQQDMDCATAHCANGLCCKSGDCCSDVSMCTKYAVPAACTDPARCVGTRSDAACVDSQCQSVTMSDAAACVGTKVADCGEYVDVTCTDRMVSTVCATECLSHSQCKADAYCDALDSGRPGKCRSKLADGTRCSSSAQCEVGCTDGVCCSDTGPNAHCCSVDDDCRSLNTSGCAADDNSCAGVTNTATCNVRAHRCVVVPRPDDTACKRTVTCGPAYNTSFECPLTCRCTPAATECAIGYRCDVQSSQCVRSDIGGMSGAGGTPAGNGASGMQGTAGQAGQPGLSGNAGINR